LRRGRFGPASAGVGVIYVALTSMTQNAGCNWHVDCKIACMTDDRYLSLLVWTICMLMFACGVVAITQHPEWFGA